MSRPARRCWVCSPGGSNDGVCDECRKVIASERKCRSSAACGEAAGHGLYGVLCADHAAEIEDVRERWFLPSGAVRRTEATPEAEKAEAEAAEAAEAPEAEAEPPAITPKKRVSREELAARVVEVVRAADRPQSYGDLASRLGMARNSSSLKRAARLAQERGRITLDNGRGFSPA